MKLLHRELWMYFVLVLVVIEIVMLLTGMTLWFLVQDIRTNLNQGIFFLLLILIGVGIDAIMWRYLTIRFFDVQPSASFAYQWNSGPWVCWTKNPINSITVNWITKEKSTGTIHYFPTQNPSETHTLAVPEAKAHHHTIENLHPDTDYTYSIQSNDLNIQDYHFHTAPAEPRNVDLIVMGDSQNGGGEGPSDWAYPKLVKLATEKFPNTEIFCHVGDFVDQGSDLRAWHTTITASAPLFRTLPFHVAIGNHDGGTRDMHDNTMKLYPDEGANWDYIMNYHYDNPNDEEITPYRSRYYSFRYGNAQLIFLDSKESGKAEPHNPQWEYLDHLLAELPPNLWKIIFIHRPILRGIIDRKDKQLKLSEDKFTQYLLPIITKHRVDLVVQGHQHFFQTLHYYPPHNQINKSQKEQYLTFLITGGSGNHERDNPPVEIPDVSRKNTKDGAQFQLIYEENTSHILHLQIQKSEILFTSIRIDGTMMYSGKVTKFSQFSNNNSNIHST